MTKTPTAESTRMLVLKNKAYTMLHELIDEVIIYGRRAYRNEPKIASQFSIEYRSRKRRQATKQPAETAA